MQKPMIGPWKKSKARPKKQTDFDAIDSKQKPLKLPTDLSDSEPDFDVDAVKDIQP